MLFIKMSSKQKNQNLTRDMKDPTQSHKNTEKNLKILINEGMCHVQKLKETIF